VEGGILSGPRILDIFSLFEYPVSFVDSFCRGLGFTLAAWSISCLGWTRCGLWDLLGLTELAGAEFLATMR
jgi:hypothetical protein